MDKIKYLAHPVSKDVVKDWNKKGCRVIDARFNPNPEAEKQKPKHKAKSKTKAEKS